MIRAAATTIFAAALALGTAEYAPKSTAQESITGRPVDDEDGSITGKAAPAESSITVQIDSSACAAAARYAPQEDVEYKPGVDADGKAVASADLPGNPAIRVPDRVQIPLSRDLAHQLRLPRGQHADAFVGLVTADGGHLSFNGQPLDDAGDAEIAQACADARKKR